MANRTVRAATDTLYRPALSDDLDTLAEVAWRAFQQFDVPTWTRMLSPSHHLAPEDTVVALVDGTPAAHASALRFRMSLGGGDVPMRGIAAVAVAPEYRRRGLADGLLRDILHRLQGQGVAWSLLYPFSVPFYRKFGYGVGDTYDLIEVAPALLPASPARHRVRRLQASQDGAALARLYQAQRTRYNGLIERTDAWWQERVLKRASGGVVYVDDQTGTIGGYLLYTVPAVPSRLGAQICQVLEWVAEDPQAASGLFGFLNSLGEQYGTVVLSVPPGDAVHLLQNYPVAEGHKVAASQVVGTMARVVDVRLALETHPALIAAPGRTRVGLDVADATLPQHEGAWDLTFGSGEVRAERGSGAPERLHLDVHHLASTLLGALDPVRLWQYGQIGGSLAAAEALRVPLASHRPHLSGLNGF